MRNHNRVINLLIIAIILSTFTPVSIISTSVKASFKDSEMVSEDNKPLSSREIDEIKVKRALEHKMVSERLKSSGLSKEQVVEKMDSMSDQEIHKLASMSDKIPAGGHGGAGVVFAVLAVVVLVLLIIYLFQRV